MQSSIQLRHYRRMWLIATNRWRFYPLKPSAAATFLPFKQDGAEQWMQLLE